MTATVGTVIDRDAESREWLRERFEAMASKLVTTWDIAQDIAANWNEGRNISALPECAGKYPGQVFREWLEGGEAVDGRPSIGKPERRLLRKQLQAARIQRLAPEEYSDLDWSLYAELPAEADLDEVADIFERAAAQPLGISQRGLRLVQGNVTGMKPPYWQQVISDLMTGAHGLTPSTARNIIATATTWLQENPDAATRR